VRNKELQKRYGRREYEGLDGELCAGDPTAEGGFHRTSSVVKKADRDAGDTKLYVIDYVDRGGSLLDLRARIGRLQERTLDRESVVLIKQTLIKTVAQLQAYEADAVADGWEGVMLRRADQGVYPQKSGKSNRSTLNEFYLARLKRFEHADAVIVSFHPLKHNLNEERTATGARSTKKAGKVVDATKVGSVTLRDVATGVEFDTTVGAEALRSWSGWASAVGQTVRYKYQKVGTKDRPRINTCEFAELGVTK
jgi:ATP-dependent DNA ligase